METGFFVIGPDDFGACCTKCKNPLLEGEPVQVCVREMYDDPVEVNGVEYQGVVELICLTCELKELTL